MCIRDSDLEVHRGGHEVDDEQQHEGDDHALVDRIPDTFWTATGSQALYAATTAAMTPKIRALISPAYRSGTWASAVNEAMYAPGVPPWICLLYTSDAAD